MTALVYIGQEVLEHRDVPDPKTASGEILVKLDSVGICGFNINAFLDNDERWPAPMILKWPGP